MPEERVLLVSMPVSVAHFPSMGLSLLKPALTRLGLRCDVRYFSLDYVSRLGPDAHEFLTDSDYYMAHVGEWVFSAAVDGRARLEDLRYLTEFLQPGFPQYYTVSRLMAFLSARHEAGAFIADCLRKVDWAKYSIVGFTTSFQQNMASLALARRVKERFPHLLIAFGGGNCEGDMGIELHRKYPFIDAVCLGEGDRAFPELVRRHIAGEDCEGIPAMVVRRGAETVIPARLTAPVDDMDGLPYPDFSDFFEQHTRSKVASKHYPPAAGFETSRGCWWGAKHHCTFCGLNGMTMAYRSKSQKRAYEELAYLASRYGSDFTNADNILDPRYFEEFIPRLADQGPRVTVYYQMKVNLRPEQLTLLSRAGIKKIQPGIESLDSRILKLIDKGCTMLQNVQTLRLAAENGIYVEWLALYGIPGETPEHYRQIAGIIPKLRHLQPPSGFIRTRADRFSPYFYRPEAYGVTLAPAPAYRFIYPFDDDSLRRLAYHFDMRSDQLAAVEEYVAPAGAEYAAWEAHKDDSALCSEDLGDEIAVTDERWGWPRTKWNLRAAEAEIFRLCWRITPRHRIGSILGGRYGEAAIRTAVDRLCERGLLLEEGDSFLGLALRQPGYRRAPTWDEIRLSRVTPYAIAQHEMAQAGSQ